ncbi:vacuolar serine-type carboxypeptidase Atg42p [Trichomonascus vanleenenianus]|uniref:vacuolar serine-type carboxypeptidase Atg42p n=1 Tax=Trichomonascus vanleenenianus TaxID=2268995 RepID=UPI003EC9CFDA
MFYLLPVLVLLCKCFAAVPLSKKGITIHNVTELGVDSVNQYAGYVDVAGGKNSLFYWFFESRNDPANDPIMLWLNGGPGCSSFKGTFFVNGPSYLDGNLTLHKNPYAWNDNCSVIYVDSPAGTGMSIAHESVLEDSQVGSQIYRFLETFFEAFPQYQSNDFHLSGQSDAGHYLADIGADILSHDDRRFNFKSLSIGNGLIDSSIQYQYFQPMFCGQGGYPSLLSAATCQQMATDTPLCIDKIRACNAGKANCTEALNFCDAVTFQKYHGNYFDLTTPCSPGPECYPQDAWYVEYMNQDKVLKAVGAEKTSFAACNQTIIGDFARSGAQLDSGGQNLTDVLNAEIPLLIFAGDADTTYNWLGNLAVAKSIQWKGQSEFNMTVPRTWTFDNKAVGQITNYDILTFVRVYHAGHLVPFSNPPAALNMINNWMKGNYKINE